MYGLIASDYKCSVKFFEAVSTQGIVNKVKNLFGGSGYENYEKFSKSVNNILKSYKVNYEGFCMGWAPFLEVDYPEVYDELSQKTNNSFQAIVTEVTDVEFIEDEYELAMNQSIRIPASVYPGTATDKLLTYSSSNNDVVTVDYSGTITPVGEGTVTIFATANNGVSDSCEITVYPYNVKENDTGYTINKYVGSASEVSIPDELNDISITQIGPDAFSECECLKFVIIPNSVTSIGNSAFGGCKYLTSVTIGEGVISIGANAFDCCASLPSITIPDSVESISNSAFSGCTSLISIKVSEHNAFYCSVEGVLFDKEQITLITYPSGKSDESYVIKNGVKNIGLRAFRDCINLKSISIPASIEYIAYANWNGCDNLVDIHITDIASWCAIVFDYKLFAYSSNPLVYAENLYLNGELVKNLVIPRTVTKINERAFAGYDKLSSVVIRSSVTSIGSSAFTRSDSLTVYCYPETVAHTYCEENSIPYILYQMLPVGSTKIDKDNKLVFTSNYLNKFLTDIVTVTGYKLEGLTINGSFFFGTGATLSLFEEEENIGDYTIIVEGDLNGDSVCDVLDAASAHLYSVGLDEPSENEILAANGCISDEIDVNSYQNVVNMCLAS